MSAVGGAVGSLLGLVAGAVAANWHVSNDRLYNGYGIVFAPIPYLFLMLVGSLAGTFLGISCGEQVHERYFAGEKCDLIVGNSDSDDERVATQ